MARSLNSYETKRLRRKPRKKRSIKVSPQKKGRKRTQSINEHTEQSKKSKKRSRKTPPPGEPFGDDNIEFVQPTSGFPPKIKIKDLENKELNGVYTFKAAGGEGILYLHTNEKYILKLLFSSVYAVLCDQLEIQHLAKNVAPTILAHVSEEKALNIDNKDTYGYIMDYLKVPLPLDKLLSDGENWKKLYKLLYELIYICRLKLGNDWLGYTGDHLFLKDDKIFIIDFGNITNQNGSKTSKSLYESALKDVVDRVKNIDTDEKKLFIEEGRSFLTQKGGVLRNKYKRRVRRSRRKHMRRLRKKY